MCTWGGAYEYRVMYVVLQLGQSLAFAKRHIEVRQFGACGGHELDFTHEGARYVQLG